MAAFIKILLVYTNVVLRLDLTTSEEQNLSESHKFNSFKCMQFSIVILRSSQFLQINISTSPAQRYVYLCSWINLSSVGFYFFCVKGNKIVIGVQHIIYRVFFWPILVTNPCLPSVSVILKFGKNPADRYGLLQRAFHGEGSVASAESVNCRHSLLFVNE